MVAWWHGSPGEERSQEVQRPRERAPEGGCSATGASMSRVTRGPAGGDWWAKLGAAAVERDRRQSGGGGSTAASSFAPEDHREAAGGQNQRQHSERGTAGQWCRPRSSKKIHRRTSRRRLAAETVTAGSKGDCVRGSSVASAAARRFAGGLVRGAWRVKLAAAVSMRPSEITGT